MRELNREQLREDIWNLTVFSVVRKIYDIYNCGAIALELESRKYTDKISLEEYLKVKECFEGFSPKWISKKAIIDYMVYRGLLDNHSYYEELLPLENTESIFYCAGDSGHFVGDIFLSSKKYDEADIELYKNVYLHEEKIDMYEDDDISYDGVMDYLSFLGVSFSDNIDFEGEDFLGTEIEGIEINNGELCIARHDFNFLSQVRSLTKNNKLKGLINYFIKSFIKINGENRETAIVDDLLSDGLNVIFFENECATGDEEGQIVREIGNSVHLILLSDILVEELKKEGYALR